MNYELRAYLSGRQVTNYGLRFLGTVILCFGVFVFFAFPVHAETVEPGTVLDPTFGPNGGNVTSLQGPKGDTGPAGNPFGGGAFTDDVNFEKKVGIGLATPGYPLDVQGAMRVQSVLYTPLVTTLAGNLTLDTFQHGSDIILGSNYLTVKSGGNVGIGTVSPSYKLDIISGAARIAGADGRLILESTDAANKKWYIVSSSASDFRITEDGVADRLTIKPTTGNVGIGTTTPVTKLDVNGGARVEGTVTAGGFCIGTDCKSSWSAIGGTPTLQQVTDQGATTTKSVRFGELEGGNTTGVFEINGNSDASNGPFVELWGKDSTLDVNRRGELTLGSHNNGSVQFFNYNAISQWGPLMTLRPDGKVGIGTTVPKTRVDIRGTSATTDATVQIVGEGTSTLLLGQDARGGVIRGQGASNELKLVVGGSADTAAAIGGTEAVRIISSGNVGIGTPTPTAKLDIYGDASNDVSSPTFAITGNGTGSKLTAGLRYGGQDNAWINGAGALVLNPTGGRVGINYQNPQAMLDVNGTALFRSSVEVNAGPIELKTDNADSRMLFHDPGDAWVAIGLDRSDNNLFKINNGPDVGSATQFVLNPGDGTFGIGKIPNAAYRLDVSGKANATELCIGGACKNAWPAGTNWVDVADRPPGLDDGDQGITVESDPTVAASVKDGVSWSEIQGTSPYVPATGGSFSGVVNFTGAQVNAQQGLVVGGDLQAPTNIRNECAWNSTAVGVWTGTTAFCPEGKFVAGLRIEDTYGEIAQVEMYCCKL